ncbi:MAG TPA: hypothetical protein VFG86_01175 [Chloroflexota bacterium]|jgi:hypothetical protein|nr:hypothetical protein [Chloroflexota bacterium]
MRKENIGYLSGDAATTLQLGAFAFFAAAAVPNMPPLDSSAVDHASFYAQHWATLNVANFLYLVPIPFFLVFLGGLFASMTRAEGGAGVLTVADIGADIAMAMTWPTGILIVHTGQGLARHGLDPATVVAFDGVAQHALALSGLPRAVLITGAALVLFGAHWLWWVGVATAALGLVGSATLIVPELYLVAALSAILFNVWPLALCSVLVRGGHVLGA